MSRTRPSRLLESPQDPSTGVCIGLRGGNTPEPGAGDSGRSRRHRRRGSRARRGPVLISALLAALLVAGCNGLTPVSEPREARLPTAAEATPRGPGALFPSVESAVRGALAWARHSADRRDRTRLRMGTIRRVQGGYSFTPARRSSARVGSMRRPGLRVRLGPEDVASYVVHPVSGDPRLDRRHERVSAGERRLVDALDPRHRPLYVLTPSARVLRYVHSGDDDGQVHGEALAERRTRPDRDPEASRTPDTALLLDLHGHSPRR